MKSNNILKILIGVVIVLLIFAVIGKIEIIRLRRIFGGESIDLFDTRDDADLMAQILNSSLLQAGEVCYLQIRETRLFGFKQQIG